MVLKEAAAWPRMRSISHTDAQDRVVRCVEVKFLEEVGALDTSAGTGQANIPPNPSQRQSHFLVRESTEQPWNRATSHGAQWSGRRSRADLGGGHGLVQGEGRERENGREREGGRREAPRLLLATGDGTRRGLVQDTVVWQVLLTCLFVILLPRTLGFKVYF